MNTRAVFDDFILGGLRCCDHISCLCSPEEWRKIICDATGLDHGIDHPSSLEAKHHPLRT
jgi:hypothetical protein